MIKKIALLGSTGSIGTQTLQVIKDNKNLYQVQSLVAFSNAEILSQQAKEFGAQYYATITNDGIECLEKAVDGADIVPWLSAACPGQASGESPVSLPGRRSQGNIPPPTASPPDPACWKRWQRDIFPE